MQQTEFPFVCTIFDDASTDGEQTVLNNYLDDFFDIEGRKQEETNDYSLIFARHKKNINCYFAVFFLKYNHLSINRDKYLYASEWQDHVKYIALCEGDDYWISPMKLQKQVDYMEEHPNCSMCYHNAIKYYIQSKRMVLFNKSDEDSYLSTHDAIFNWKVPTASILVRYDYIHYPKWMKKIYSGDYALILRCLHYGDIFGFKDIMSVYRVNYEGTSFTAMMSGKKVYVIEQHILLLNSFNEGTNYQYSSEINNKLLELKRELKFQKQRTDKSIMILLNPIFWKRIYMKLSK